MIASHEGPERWVVQHHFISDVSGGRFSLQRETLKSLELKWLRLSSVTLSKCLHASVGATQSEVVSIFFFFPLTLCVSVSERKEVKGYLHGVLYPQQVLRASLDLCQAFWTRPQKTEICCICSHEIDSPLFGLSPLCLLRIIPTSECVFLSQQADLFQLFLLLLFNDIQREQLTSRVTATFIKDLLLKVCLLPGDKTQSVFFIIAPESADEQVQVLS